MDVPDLAEYRPHRVDDTVVLDGVPVPGLTAQFHRRPAPEGERSVGIYHHAGIEVLMAWGYVTEPHCRAHRVREPDGPWGPPRPGCPDVRPADPTGAPPAVRCASGAWLPLPSPP